MSLKRAKVCVSGSTKKRWVKQSSMLSCNPKAAWFSLKPLTQASHSHPCLQKLLTARSKPARGTRSLLPCPYEVQTVNSKNGRNNVLQRCCKILWDFTKFPNFCPKNKVETEKGPPTTIFPEVITSLICRNISIISKQLSPIFRFKNSSPGKSWPCQSSVRPARRADL